MRAIRWFWEGSPLATGLVLGLLLVAINFGLGVRIHPYLFVAGLGVLALLWLAAVFLFQAARFALMAPEDRRWRLRVFQTNYGRGGGWYVEQAGKRLALLTDPLFEGMFWDSFAVEPLMEDPAERERIVSDPEWWYQSGLEFRSREFDHVAPTAFVAGRVFSGQGRVLMRALYLYIGPPTMWERFWLRWFARTSHTEPDGMLSTPHPRGSSDGRG